jgi:hypothetical protein
MPHTFIDGENLASFAIYVLGDYSLIYSLADYALFNGLILIF